MPTYAVTAVGPDGPGEVAALAGALADLGANLEDATMTRLRGHFAMTVVARAPVDLATVEAALAPVGRARGLHVSVWPVDDAEDLAAPDLPRWRVTLHGADQPGLVAAVCGQLAAAGGNISDLGCRLVDDLYVMTVDVEGPEALDLADLAGRLGMSLHVQRVDEDVL